MSDFKQYPKLLKAQIKAYQTYLDNHPNSKFVQLLGGSAYNGFFYRLFCRSTEEFELAIHGGLFPENAIDAKKFLEDYFGLEL